MSYCHHYQLPDIIHLSGVTIYIVCCIHLLYAYENIVLPLYLQHNITKKISNISFISTLESYNITITM